MKLSLVMFKADGERREFHLTKPTTIIGRKTSCDLRIPLSSVSRQHCQIDIRGEQATLRDLGSSNGTFYEGRRIQEVEIAAGETIKIGPVYFTVRVEGVPPINDIVPNTTVLEDSAAGMSSPAPASTAEPEAAIAEAEVVEDDLVDAELADDDLLVEDDFEEFDEVEEEQPAEDATTEKKEGSSFGFGLSDVINSKEPEIQEEVEIEELSSDQGSFFGFSAAGDLANQPVEEDMKQTDADLAEALAANEEEFVPDPDAMPSSGGLAFEEEISPGIGSGGIGKVLDERDPPPGEMPEVDLEELNQEEIEELEKAGEIETQEAAAEEWLGEDADGDDSFDEEIGEASHEEVVEEVVEYLDMDSGEMRAAGVDPDDSAVEIEFEEVIVESEDAEGDEDEDVEYKYEYVDEDELDGDEDVEYEYEEVLVDEDGNPIEEDDVAEEADEDPADALMDLEFEDESDDADDDDPWDALEGLADDDDDGDGPAFIIDDEDDK